MKLTDNAESVLRKRYYKRDEDDKPCEDFDQLVHRVA